MSGSTPDQLRNINALVERFDKDWFADTQTMEIRRKPREGWRKAFDVIWKRKHTVFALYWWVRRNWANERLIVHHYPVRSDNMPIKGFPVKCELQGGWTIPKEDLRFLTHGPLASEGLYEILVPAAVGWQRIWLFVRQFGPVVTTLIGIAGALVRWWPEMLSLWSLAF